LSIGYDRTPAAPQRGPVQKMGGTSSLAEVLNIILDKGIVIDAWARVSVVGIEILTIEARVVVASVETYLRYAESIGLTALAAPPSNRQNGERRRDDDEGRELPSDDEIINYLSDHSEGLRLGEMEAYFNVPRRELADTLDELADDDRVRLDEERKLYYSIDEGDEDEDEDRD
jgi:gas vesicle structural protein